VYRFLLSARWLGLAALAIALAAVMVAAGRWQWDRYHERSAINARIDAADTVTPAPARRALPDPGDAAGVAGPAAPEAAEWSAVTATGRYDPTRQVLVRGRTVQGRVGYEVLTPLVLDGGDALLVDRGWFPYPAAGPNSRPDVPAAPSGPVTVVGRVAPSEARPGPLREAGGLIEVRRIAVPQVAAELPYPVFGSYLLLHPGQPGGGPDLTPVPSPRQRAWQNAGYAVQWWLFAALTLVGFAWLVRREAHGPPEPIGHDRVPTDRVPPENGTAPTGPAGAAPRDRPFTTR
jgi:cytochrome oxidase assembly protein ShyY1